MTEQGPLYPHIATAKAKAGVAEYYDRPRPWNRNQPAPADAAPELDGYAANVAATHGNAGGQQVRPAGGEWWEAPNLTADGERI